MFYNVSDLLSGLLKAKFNINNVYKITYGDYIINFKSLISFSYYIGFILIKKLLF